MLTRAGTKARPLGMGLLVGKPASFQDVGDCEIVFVDVEAVGGVFPGAVAGGEAFEFFVSFSRVSWWCDNVLDVLGVQK